MSYGESNGHVTDDVMQCRKIKLVTPIRLEPISKTRKRLGSKGPPIGNGLWGSKWSHARWRHDV